MSGISARVSRLAMAMVIVAAVQLPGSLAHADSCWDHNGSLMRLEASANARWFYYEIPREALRRVGVGEGTLLFNGYKDGNWYSGTARRFSRFCPTTPLEYFVEGPVREDQLQVTVRGMREIHEQCEPTGQFVPDELIFTYVRDC